MEEPKTFPQDSEVKGPSLGFNPSTLLDKDPKEWTSEEDEWFIKDINEEAARTGESPDIVGSRRFDNHRKAKEAEQGSWTDTVVASGLEAEHQFEGVVKAGLGAFKSAATKVFSPGHPWEYPDVYKGLNSVLSFFGEERDFSDMNTKLDPDQTLGQALFPFLEFTSGMVSSAVAGKVSTGVSMMLEPGTLMQTQAATKSVDFLAKQGFNRKIVQSLAEYGTYFTEAYGLEGYLAEAALFDKREKLSDVAKEVWGKITPEQWAEMGRIQKYFLTVGKAMSPFLAADPDDSDAMLEAKRVIEGIGTTVAVMGPLIGLKNLAMAGWGGLKNKIYGPSVDEMNKAVAKHTAPMTPKDLPSFPPEPFPKQAPGQQLTLDPSLQPKIQEPQGDLRSLAQVPESSNMMPTPRQRTFDELPKPPETQLTFEDLGRVEMPGSAPKAPTAPIELTPDNLIKIAQRTFDEIDPGFSGGPVVPRQGTFWDILQEAPREAPDAVGVQGSLDNLPGRQLEFDLEGKPLNPPDETRGMPQKPPETAQGAPEVPPKVETQGPEVPKAPKASEATGEPGKAEVAPGADPEVVVKAAPEAVPAAPLKEMPNIPGITQTEHDIAVSAMMPEDLLKPGRTFAQAAEIYTKVTDAYTKFFANKVTFTPTVPSEYVEFAKHILQKYTGGDASFHITANGESFGVPFLDARTSRSKNSYMKSRTAFPTERLGSPAVPGAYRIARDGVRVINLGAVTPADLTHELLHAILKDSLRFVPEEDFLEFLGKAQKLHSEALTAATGSKAWGKVSTVSDLNRGFFISLRQGVEEVVAQQFSKMYEHAANYAKSTKLGRWFQSTKDKMVAALGDVEARFGPLKTDAETFFKQFMEKLSKGAQASRKASGKTQAVTELALGISESLAPKAPDMSVLRNIGGISFKEGAQGPILRSRRGFLDTSVVGHTLPHVVSGFAPWVFQVDINGDGVIDAGDYVGAALGSVALRAMISQMGSSVVTKGGLSSQTKSMVEPMKQTLAGVKKIQGALDNVEKALAKATAEGAEAGVIEALKNEQKLIQTALVRAPKTISDIKNLMKPGSVLGDYATALQNGVKTVGDLPVAEYEQAIKAFVAGDETQASKLFTFDTNALNSPEGLQATFENLRTKIGEAFDKHHAVEGDVYGEAKALKLMKDMGADWGTAGQLLMNTKNKTRDLFIHLKASQAAMDIVQGRAKALAEKGAKAPLSHLEQLELRTLLTQMPLLESLYRDIGSDQGRAFRVLQNSYWFRSNKPEQLKELVDSLGGPEGTQRLIEFINGNDRSAIRRMARLQLQNPYLRPIQGIMYHSMLSSFAVHQANFMSNTLFLGSSVLEQVGVSALSGFSAESRGAAGAYMGGLIGSIGDALSATKQSFMEGPTALKGEDFSSMSSKELRAAFPEMGPVAARVVEGLNVLEKGFRLVNLDPTRALGAADMFNRTLAYGARFRQLTFMAASEASAKTGEAFESIFKKMLDNPSIEIVEKAADFGHKMTLTSKLKGFAAHANLFRNQVPFGLGSIFVPFFKTSANAVLETIERTPLGVLTDGTREALMKGGVEAKEAMAKMTAGGLLLTAGYALADKEVLRGNTPTKTPGTSRMILPEAHVNIGGHNYPTKLFGIYGRLMTMGADIRDFVKFTNRKEFNKVDLTLEDPDVLDWVTSMSLVAAQAATEPGFAEGLSDFMGLLKVDRVSTSKAAADKLVDSFVTRLSPGWINSVRKAEDEQLRIVQGMRDALMNKWPLMSRELPRNAGLLNEDQVPGVPMSHPIYRTMADHGVDIGPFMRGRQKLDGVSLTKPMMEDHMKYIGEYLSKNYPKAASALERRKLLPRDKQKILRKLLSDSEKFSRGKLWRKYRGTLEERTRKHDALTLLMQEQEMEAEGGTQ